MSASFPALIPQPLHCSPQDGAAFALTAKTVVIATGALASAADMLAARLRQGTSWALPLIASPAAAGDNPRIEFRLSPAPLASPEAYALRVMATSVTITASAAAGAYYGGQTFLQLLPAAIFGAEPRPDLTWTAPAIAIEDSPRFRWRGVLVDSARYFQPISYLKKFIDVMSQHKFNVFHWHIVDDQGWRIEIKKYPKLTSVGSKRRETMRGHKTNNLSGDGVPIEGFYTQDQIRDLVAYAAERHVQIMPEIEMPGHAQAAIAAYPELGLLSPAKDVSCTWGIHHTLFNTKPATFAFLQDVLREVIALFPFEYLHIGGDEAVKKQWQQDAATQAHMQKLGLATEDDLQGWFIRQMEDFLKKHGRRLTGWEEILQGGLAKSATVTAARGAVEVARLGNDIVMCPFEYAYYDYYQSSTPATEPLAIMGDLPLEKAHGYEPVPLAFTAEEGRCVIGVQGQLWTEYIATPSRLEFMAFPRLCAMAEVGWSPKDRPAFSDFLARLCIHLRRLDVQDVRYRAPLEFIRP